MALIAKSPIYVDLDRRRELVFNLNAEAIIQSAGKRHADLWMKIGEEADPETGKVKDTLDLNVENFRLYLFAALQQDIRAHGEKLTLEDVGALIGNRRRSLKAFEALSEALNRYYGRDEDSGQGEG